MSRLLSAAISRALAEALAGRPNSPPLPMALAAAEPPRRISKHFAPTRKRLGPLTQRNLSEMKVRPVPPDHRFAPDAGRFRVEGDTLYVLESDWPKLRESLQRQRAKSAAETPHG